MQYPLPVLLLSRRALPRTPRTFALSCRRRTASCLCRLRGAVVALPFAADACLVASSFEATPMMPMTPPNWLTMRQPFLRFCAGFRRFRVRFGCLRCGCDLAAALACSAASPAFVVAIERTMQRFLPIFRRR